MPTKKRYSEMPETNAHLTADEIAEELRDSDYVIVESVRDDDLVVQVTNRHWTEKQAGSRINAASSTVLSVYTTGTPGVYVVEDSDYEPITEVKDASEVF